MSWWHETTIIGSAVLLFAALFVGTALLTDPPVTTEQRERSARAFADKLGLHVVGVSCEWIECTITYESGEGVRAIGAVCGAESCAGDL